MASQSIGTLETHPIDMISAFGMIGNGGVLMPHHTILKVLDDNDVQVWPAKDAKPTGERVVCRQAAYIITDILAGNTIASVNPFWAQVADHRRRHGLADRPAAYKTGTTSDNRDVHAYGYLAMPSSKDEPALVAGRLDGQLGQLAQRRQALARHLGAAVVGDPLRRLQGPADRGLRPHQAQGPGHGHGRRLHGHAAQRRHAQDGRGAVPPRHRADDERDLLAGASTSTRRAASSGGRAASGPMVTKSFIDYSKAEAGFKAWQKADAALAGARRSRPGRAAVGPKGTRTAYFYGSATASLVSLRAQLGRILRAHEEVPDRAAAAHGLRVRPIPLRRARRSCPSPRRPLPPAPAAASPARRPSPDARAGLR